MSKLLFKSILAFLLGAFAFTFVGCGSQKQVVVAESKVQPSWYTNPPVSNDTELYAIGDGKDKQEAITNALTQMVSTLSVSIASTYSAKTVVKEGRVNTSDALYVSDTQSDVQKIRISNYELLQAESFGFKKYAVLIKSNKEKLFLSMKQETEQNFALISQNEQTLKRANVLKQLSFYRATKASLSTLPNRLIVMNVLHPSFDSNAYLKQMQGINTKYETLLREISFSITSDAHATNLIAPIAKGLSAKKFKINDAKTRENFTVYVTSKIEQASSYGFTLARSDVSIITKDDSGTVIGSSTLNIIGQSSQGFSVAKQNIALKLNALIEKEGIGKIMGLDI
jgi:hypothetical protein